MSETLQIKTDAPFLACLTVSGGSPVSVGRVNYFPNSRGKLHALFFKSFKPYSNFLCPPFLSLSPSLSPDLLLIRNLQEVLQCSCQHGSSYVVDYSGGEEHQRAQ